MLLVQTYTYLYTHKIKKDKKINHDFMKFAHETVIKQGFKAHTHAHTQTNTHPSSTYSEGFESRAVSEVIAYKLTSWLLSSISH